MDLCLGPTFGRSRLQVAGCTLRVLTEPFFTLDSRFYLIRTPYMNSIFNFIPPFFSSMYLLNSYFSYFSLYSRTLNRFVPSPITYNSYLYLPSDILSRPYINPVTLLSPSINPFIILHSLSTLDTFL